MRFFYCPECNQVHIRLIDSDKPIVCCENPVEELVNNPISDELDEHKPTIRKIGNFVTITVDHHPMLDIHHLLFIFLETNQGFQYKYLKQDSLPKVEFILAQNEEIVNVFVYCNVHLLWTMNQI